MIPDVRSAAALHLLEQPLNVKITSAEKSEVSKLRISEDCEKTSRIPITVSFSPILRASDLPSFQFFQRLQLPGGASMPES
jgi:hypothetical protein